MTTQTDLKTYVETKTDFRKKSIRKKKVSVQSIYCFTKESELVLKLYNYFVQISKKYETDISFIPFFDGAFIKFDKEMALLTFQGQLFNFKDNINQFNTTISPFRFEIKPIEPNWTHLNLETFNYYLEINDFLLENKLSLKQYIILLKLLNIPDFSLNDTIYKTMELEKKKKNINDLNPELIEHLTFLTTHYKKTLNLKLIDYIKKNKSLLFLLKEIEEYTL